MKKATRRSKQTAAAEDVIVDDKQQHQEKQIPDLQQENRDLKKEVEELRSKLANVVVVSDNSTQKAERDYLQKLNVLEDKVMELKSKLYAQSRSSARRPKPDESVKRLQDEIQILKAQKVKLLCKMKLESVQFRFCKASLEKEALQLKREVRRHEYDMQKLSTLNQRQKQVLQRKAEEASMATRRLKEILKSRKTMLCRRGGAKKISSVEVQAIENELDVTERVREVCAEYEQQIEEMAGEMERLKDEAEALREEHFRFLLQNKEVDCRAEDSELRDLKEKVKELSSLVSQLEPRKAVLTQREHEQVNIAQTFISLGSNMALPETTSTESRCSERSLASVGKELSGICCSCGRKSLCKTMKCQCRANGGSCGASCGCAPSKCANREAVSFKLDDSLQKKDAKDRAKGSGKIATEKSDILASHGAMLLQNALLEKPDEKNGIKGPRGKPLSDIGNTVANASKPRQKKKGKNIAIRLVPEPEVPPPSSQAEQ